jgi:16S rRNA (cytosine967-C5)-methyltransferase
VDSPRGRARSSADSGPRAVALRVVRRVTEENAYSTLALDGELRRTSLSQRDRRFAADLAYGTLRAMLRLDRAIAQRSSRSMESLDREVRAVLRIGAYQLLEAGVPAHAAVSETVTLAPVRARGFVNAVLRRLAARPPRAPTGTGDEDIAARTGLVRWAVAELHHLLPASEVEIAATALATPAGLSLRVNRCRVSIERLVAELRAAGHRPEPGRHHPDVVRLARGRPPQLPGHAEGWFAVQDEASTLVSAALAPSPGERILDACAGPGGKAADLACRVLPDGLVVAGDAHPARARLVGRTAGRLGVRVAVLVADARLPAVRGTFDAVLVDAPCSGLGTARRHPEVLWRPRRQDLSGLARLQVAILGASADLVRPGGRLVYSVCTFPRAETEAALRAFSARRDDFEPMDIAGPDGRAPVHRLWPHRHGTDAMFFAGFRRTRG